MYGPVLKVEMFKSVRCCGTKHMSKSKCAKHVRFGTLLEVDMSKKCTLLWCETDFEVKSVNWRVRTTFGRSDLVLRGRRKGLCTLSKMSKLWGFCGNSKHDGRRGTCEEDLQRCIFRGRRSTRDIFIRAVRRSGRWFPERGCILEHQIFRFVKMILRDKWTTSFDLASLFVAGAALSTDGMEKIVKRIGTRPSALHVFEGSLTELLRFWVCQVQKLRKSRRIAAFSSLWIADRQIDR